MKYCNKCGTQLPDEAAFCTSCGTPVEEYIEETGILYDEDDGEDTTVLNNAYDVHREEPAFMNQDYAGGLSNQQSQGTVPPEYMNPSYNNQQAQPFAQPQPSAYSQGYKGQYNQQSAYQNNQQNPYNPIHNTANVIENPTLSSCYKKYWKNYANFEGRSRRSEYWFVVLANALFSLVNIIPYVGPVLSTIYMLAVIVPNLALMVRRLHDIGKPWPFIFFMLIPIAGPIIMLVWFCTDSQVGANEFGENPKGIN